MEVAPGGGSDRPETDPGAEAVLFVVEGELRLTVGGDEPKEAKLTKLRLLVGKALGRLRD